jgi:hypothetical protein
MHPNLAREAPMRAADSVWIGTSLATGLPFFVMTRPSGPNRSRIARQSCLNFAASSVLMAWSLAVDENSIPLKARRSSSIPRQLLDDQRAAAQLGSGGAAEEAVALSIRDAEVLGQQVDRRAEVGEVEEGDQAGRGGGDLG